jgi:hypothetical protein
MSTPLDARGTSGPVGKHDFRAFDPMPVVARKRLHTTTWCAVCRSRCWARLPCRCCLRALAEARKVAG